MTRLDFATIEAPAMTAFETFWDDAAALIAAWQDWAPDAPDALAASLLITAPPLSVKVFGAYAGPEDELRELVAALGEPQRAAFSPGSAREAKRFLAGLGGAGEEDDDGHAYLRSEYFAGTLPGDAIAELAGHLAAPGGFHRELDFSPWAGAYTRTPADATAFAHRDAHFLLKHAAVVAPAEDAERGARVGRRRLRDHPPARHRRRLPELPRGRRRPGRRPTTSAPTASGCSSCKRPLRPRRRVLVIEGLDHVQVAAPPGCEREARGFYGRLLGLPELEKPEALRAGGGVWFGAGAQELHVGVAEDFTPATRPIPACGSAPRQSSTRWPRCW